MCTLPLFLPSHSTVHPVPGTATFYHMPCPQIIITFSPAGRSRASFTCMGCTMNLCVQLYNPRTLKRRPTSDPCLIRAGVIPAICRSYHGDNPTTPPQPPIPTPQSASSPSGYHAGFFISFPSFLSMREGGRGSCGIEGEGE